jgi:hypothetical protein
MVYVDATYRYGYGYDYGYITIVFVTLACLVHDANLIS